jgi:hypothetical protein
LEKSFILSSLILFYPRSEVKIVKKVAILCALVMMISMVPVFALIQTNNTTDQVQNQTKTTTQTSTAQKTCNQTKCKATGDCDCDGDQHKYGQKNNAGDCNGEKHQYGQKNNKAGNCGNCDGDQQKYQYGQKNRNNQS